MALPSFAKQSLTVLMPILIEERGQTVEDWSNPTRRVVNGCSIQPGGGGRDFEHADGITADFTAYVPPTEVIPRRCRVELPFTDGDFILMREPQPWIFGLSTDHTQLSLRRRDG